MVAFFVLSITDYRPGDHGCGPAGSATAAWLCLSNRRDLCDQWACRTGHGGPDRGLSGHDVLEHHTKHHEEHTILRQISLRLNLWSVSGGKVFGAALAITAWR